MKKVFKTEEQIFFEKTSRERIQIREDFIVDKIEKEEKKAF